MSNGSFCLAEHFDADQGKNVGQLLMDVRGQLWGYYSDSMRMNLISYFQDFFLDFDFQEASFLPFPDDVAHFWRAVRLSTARSASFPANASPSPTRRASSRPHDHGPDASLYRLCLSSLVLCRRSTSTCAVATEIFSFDQARVLSRHLSGLDHVSNDRHHDVDVVAVDVSTPRPRRFCV